MRLLIAGSRSLHPEFVAEQVSSIVEYMNWAVSEEVSGTASGADLGGELWAEKNGVPIVKFPADWDTFGKSAGFIRNQKMGRFCDAALVFWDGSSSGSKNMIRVMRDFPKKQCVVFHVPSSSVIVTTETAEERATLEDFMKGEAVETED